MPREGAIMAVSASLFSQLLRQFPRTEFSSLVKKHGAERAAKGFGCWTQFVAMLFCKLAKAESLRKICDGLACCLGKPPHFLRRVVAWDPKAEGEIVLLTNHFHFGAATVSNIYKDRWEIEVLFKILKQNPKIKTFIGISKNALLIRIWTALSALLLLKWLDQLSKAGWPLSNPAAMLRLNLFTYRDLTGCLHDPFQTPPTAPRPIQPPPPVSHFGRPNDS